MTHTPGPLEVVSHVEGVLHVQRPGGRLGDEVAVLYGVDRRPEQFANARLMAAGPEMLTALKETLDYWTLTGFADCEEGCDCIVESVRAAIAKAEGAA